LKSEYEFVPELAMEYVMYSLIQARIEIVDDLGIETLEPIPFQRDYIMGVLCEEYSDEPKTSDDGEDIFISWREKLERHTDIFSNADNADGESGMGNESLYNLKMQNQKGNCHGVS